MDYILDRPVGPTAVAARQLPTALPCVTPTLFSWLANALRGERHHFRHAER